MEIYKQLPHTADIKIRAFGATKEELFIHALIGMFQVIGPHAKGCSTINGFLICPDLPKVHEIDVSSPDIESLLVDFLSYAWWLSDVYNEAYLAGEVHEFSDTHIKATVRGVAITGFDVVEIKAVTYHDLQIKEIDGHWEADIVFDI